MSKRKPKPEETFALTSDEAPKSTPRKPKPPARLQKQIAQYYADLKDLAHQNVMYEMGTRTAFHNLLAGAAKPHKWTLIPELERKANGKTIRPDGTFKDEMNLVRGHWEAKDPGDDLSAEITKKRKAGYPFSNIIFEDNLTAVLFQHDQEILRVDMKEPARLEELITQFLAYIEPEIEKFEDAVDIFKERVPDLAAGLAKKIAEAHKTNSNFKKAFADFFDLCRTSLNPNLSQAAVDEMLIQHILTERLIREIFDNPEFVRRNVIAAEVEKVMQAMTSQSFDRNTYLKELDRFYIAIEMAARTMTDFSDKQHFLNTVYERFFQGYSVKLADTMGIVYTPQAIVDFMCASVEEVLKTEFSKTLASEDVYIIDPCTGTGNFIVNLIRRIPKSKLEDVYKRRLFANEIMLLPYYIAALNIEHAFYEQTGRYEGFEGLCFVDTLDMAEHSQGQLSFMTAKNTERVERQRKSPITVVIGNPPYNAGQKNENDQNKNRTYEVIDGRIANTYARKSRATLRRQLYDPYVRFFRWAVDRLGDRDGIVCFVSNNSFVDQIAFDGMRRDLLRDFTHVYHVDLHGNVRQNPKLSGTTHNVFGIQVGVGITVAVRKSSKILPRLDYHRVPEKWRKELKLGWLTDQKNVSYVKWEALKPDKAYNWVISESAGEFASFISIGNKAAKASEDKVDAIFKLYGRGVASNADNYVYDFDRERLSVRARALVEDFNSELDRWKRQGRPAELETFLKVDEKVHKWIRNTRRTLARGKYVAFDEARLRAALYRPFVKQFHFFAREFNEDTYQLPRTFPTVASQQQNVVICVPGIGGRAEWATIVANTVPNLSLTSLDSFQVFPFYTYNEDGTNRRENITDWALTQFRTHYDDKKITKWNIFHYVYALLHHPAYREKFADNLKRELPRIPFAPPLAPADSKAHGTRSVGLSTGFHAFAAAGKKLADLHLNYETLKPWPLDFQEAEGIPLSYRIEDKMRLMSGRSILKINNSLALANIPSKTYDYRLGNRSALEWVIDQYQLHTDPRSQITSDPNRPDDPQYIVRLVGQVIRVSLETLEIINALPAQFAPDPKS